MKWGEYSHIFKTRYMDINETIESLIKQAEHFNAGETSLAWDYNSDWEAKIVVKSKKKTKK